MSELARFRADPARVRVGVRRYPDGTWRVVVEDRRAPGRTKGSGFCACDASPRKALVRALRGAEAVGVEGVDLALQWAYDHPQRRPGHDLPIVGITSCRHCGLVVE